MEKLETKLANKFLSNLKRSVSEHGERIKLEKIHGEIYQKSGISDWIGCWRGLFLAIEFKVYPNKASPKQISFIADIIECGGIGINITFIKNASEDYIAATWGQEYSVLFASYKDRMHNHYNFKY